jgi:hypothetical protein
MVRIGVLVCFILLNSGCVAVQGPVEKCNCPVVTSGTTNEDAPQAKTRLARTP